MNSVVYRVYNKRTRVVEFSVDMVFDEYNYTLGVVIQSIDEEGQERNSGNNLQSVPTTQNVRTTEDVEEQ